MFPHNIVVLPEIKCIQTLPCEPAVPHFIMQRTVVVQYVLGAVD